MYYSEQQMRKRFVVGIAACICAPLAVLLAGALEWHRQGPCAGAGGARLPRCPVASLVPAACHKTAAKRPSTLGVLPVGARYRCHSGVVA